MKKLLLLALFSLSALPLTARDHDGYSGGLNWGDDEDECHDDNYSGHDDGYSPWGRENG